MESSCDVPSARYSHANTTLPDGSVVVFGGSALSCSVNDVYTSEVSGTSATWTELESSGDVPSARYSHAITTLADGSVVVFGGSALSGSVNDVYTSEVSGTNASWTELESSGDVPSARSSHAITTRPLYHSLCLRTKSVGPS